ncbi:MAG TPA: DUF475 domain-containing protein, partial [Patescibacteria group bacterium]|nr:DUF475 domain-containing protein [Patescibacteria group bacterium]
IISLLPFNHHQKVTAVSGVLGVIVYTAIHGLTALFGKFEKSAEKGVNVGAQVGMAAFISLLYLEVLDATFSFDSVLGAFAVTADIIVIAVGLGVGALWVRSLTVFMVRRRTLSNYKYIEHGAHYTIAILAGILFVSLFVSVPEVITGMSGIGVIVASIIASSQALAKK